LVIKIDQDISVLKEETVDSYICFHDGKVTQ
jgi:hypothetical protein